MGQGIPGSSHTCNAFWVACQGRYICFHRDTWKTFSCRRANGSHAAHWRRSPEAWSGCRHTAQTDRRTRTREELCRRTWLAAETAVCPLVMTRVLASGVTTLSSSYSEWALWFRGPPYRYNFFSHLPQFLAGHEVRSNLLWHQDNRKGRGRTTVET